MILIADDSPIIQRRAQRILQDVGFDVQTVSNGVAAVKKLPGMQPVLVLADVSMPGKDGYEVCEFVKTSAGLRHVPVLLVGSDLEPYDEQRGARVRADGIIKKPFSPHDLVAVVRRLTTPAQAPAFPSVAEEAPAAASLTPFQEAPGESHAASQRTALPGGEEEILPAAAAAPLPVADDLAAKVWLQSDVDPGIEPGNFPEPASAAGESTPGLTPGPASDWGEEPAAEGTPEPALAATEASRKIEEATPEEIEESVPAPQLIDLTAPQGALDPNPVFAGRLSEPFPVPAPQPELIAAETNQEPEESNAQHLGELSSFPQLVDLTAADAFEEPAASIEEAPSEPAPDFSPELATAGFETAREVEDLNSLSRPLDASTFPAAQQPDEVAAAPNAEPIPDIAPETATGSSEVSQEWGDLISGPPAFETSSAPYAQWIYKVVHKVVNRMAPPVLAPDQIEELARILAREITSELDGPSGQTDFSIEGPPPD